MLIWCGEKGRDIANTWSDVTDEDKKKVKTYFERFANRVKLPDPKKISAIQEVESPRNKQKLETLLGMVNYLAKFTPNLSETAAPMRSRLKKDSEFV